MERSMIQRGLLTVLMESPFYFTIPLQTRLEFIKFLSSIHHISEYNGDHINGESDSKWSDSTNADHSTWSS